MQTLDEKRAYQRAWYAANREKARERARQDRIDNPDRYAGYQKKQAHRRAAYKRKWRAKNPDAKRQENYLREYGLTLEQVGAMFESQGFRCAVCKDESIASDTKKRHVDHCHTTGKVRSILCRRCNLTLGHAKDSPELLRKLADYLEHHSKTQKERDQEYIESLTL